VVSKEAKCFLKGSFSGPFLKVAMRKTLPGSQSRLAFYQIAFLGFLGTWQEDNYVLRTSERRVSSLEIWMKILKNAFSIKFYSSHKNFNPDIEH